MRLHHLEITAFGPFADTVHVDFDDLSESGLFLLCGPTGAGKTSVLDAVCFALYGQVPGDRNSAKRLRSDQAGPGVVPRVELEATLSGRRFRFVRCPAWERPKTRGTGTTKQQASVTVSESVDGEWTPLSSRLDESGHLVTELLGMNVDQFTQIAMLPQGRFQTFLRAGSEERHAILQKLFRTGRFEDVEKWLGEHRRGLSRESGAHHQRVADLVSRVSEVAGVGLPESWEVADLELPAASGEVTGWLDRLVADADVALTRHRAEAGRLGGVAEETRAAVESGRLLSEQRTRHARARTHDEELASATVEVDRARTRIRLARRAAGIRPVHGLATRAETEWERAVTAAEGPLRDAGRLLAEGQEVSADPGLFDEPTVHDRAGAPGADDLAAAARAAHDAAGGVRGLLPKADELGILRARIDAAVQRHTVVQTELCTLAERVESLPAGITQLRADLLDAELAEAALPAAGEAIAALADRVSARDELHQVRAHLETALALRTQAHEETLRRKEDWLGVREARIEGMAAEIAHDLAVGASCPVCGSADHPHPASPLPGAPTAAAEKRAHKLLADAEVAQEAAADGVRGLQGRITSLEQRAGKDTPVSLDEQVATARDDEAALERRAARVAVLSRKLAETERELDDARHELTLRRTEAAELGTVLSAQRTTADAIEEELTTALAGTGCADLVDLLSRHEAAEVIHDTALGVLRRVDAAEAAVTESREALADAVREAGFDTADEAVDALVPPPELETMAGRVRAHDEQVAAVRAVLEDPVLVAAAETDAPDLEKLVAADLDATTVFDRARTTAEVAATRATRLRGLGSEMAEALGAWAPVREAHALTASLAGLVEGKSKDNRLQMRLSAYVLSYRLSQVAAAANERLARMSDRRYSLEHTGTRGAGERRGGLSLLVRDDWSGEARDPATLSGGETFVVSLALALGLADVITQEAGGADLDTLFVDEGFGSLDAETLDDVMDTLDSLRSGGRVVGVVSHVSEMRSRIPAQLRVDKQRSGSGISQVRALT